MTLLDRSEEVAHSDSKAIVALRTAFDRQRVAFMAEPPPTLDERKGHLRALANMVIANKQRIRAAVADDFGSHPALFADLIESLGVAGRAAYAIEQLEGWMADDQRYADPALHGTAKAFVRYQPKGVVGNIVPWNFPFDIAVGPLVEMLAAGNRVIIKSSDFTPACGEVLAEMVASTFDPERVTVSLGGLELAKTFPTLPWDHLLYTGSPSIGREVMRAAAENLTPVTLELGGKCPAILTPDAVDATSVENILGTKMIKNGQMCISVDYVLVPRNQLREFVDIAKRHMSENVPGYSTTESCTGIISDRHLDRLIDLRQQAIDGGYEVLDLEDDPAVNRDTRQMPLSLVVDPGDELGVMHEEIFGPLLPIKPYDTLDEAIAFVNAGERPLGLYAFGRDEDRIGHVLDSITSGGAAVNTCAVQGALPSLGFGGSGNSGMGRHHGVEGFREFSNARGIVIRGENDLTSAFFAPYGELLEAVTSAGFAEAAGES